MWVLLLMELFDVSADEFRQFKHRRGIIAAEESFQLVVSVDVAFVFGVLETVFFDVVPDLFRDFAARLRSGANDCGQNCVRLHGFHKGGVCFTSSCFFGHRGAMLAVSPAWVNTSSQGFLRRTEPWFLLLEDAL